MSNCAWAMAAHSVTAPPDSSQQSAQASVGTALQLSVPFAPFHFLPSSRGVDPKSAPSEPGQTMPRAAVLVKTALRMLAQGLTPGGHHGGGSTGQCGVLLSVLDALCSWMLPLVAPVGPWPAGLPQAHSLDMKAHAWQALGAAASTCTVLRAHPYPQALCASGWGSRADWVLRLQMVPQSWSLQILLIAPWWVSYHLSFLWFLLWSGRDGAEPHGNGSAWNVVVMVVVGQTTRDPPRRRWGVKRRPGSDSAHMALCKKQEGIPGLEESLLPLQWKPELSQMTMLGCWAIDLLVSIHFST